MNIFKNQKTEVPADYIQLKINQINLQRILYASAMLLPLHLIHTIIFSWKFHKGSFGKNETLWYQGIIWSHLVMAIIAVILILSALRLKKTNRMDLLHILTTGAFFAYILFAAIIVGFDQIVTQSIVPFLIGSIGTGALLIASPITSGLIYLTGYFSFFLMISLFQDSPSLQLTAHVNGLSAVGIGFVLNFLQWKNNTRAISQDYRLAEQQKQIEENMQKIVGQRETMRKEMKIAQKIQLGMIPKTPPDIQGVKFGTLYLPVSEVGGDLYDFIQFPGSGRIGIFICDIFGHGVPAALVSGMIKMTISELGEQNLYPGEFLRLLNKRLYGKIHDLCLTAFYGIYDINNRTFHYSRCGHPYPLIIRGNEIIKLSSKGSILGFTDDIDVEEKEITLSPKDKILFFTDGLLEAINPQGEAFEEKELGKFLKEAENIPVTAIVSNLITNLFNFCDSEIFSDDICIVAMEI